MFFPWVRGLGSTHGKNRGGLHAITVSSSPGVLYSAESFCWGDHVPFRLNVVLPALQAPPPAAWVPMCGKYIQPRPCVLLPFWVSAYLAHLGDLGVWVYCCACAERGVLPVAPSYRGSGDLRASLAALTRGAGPPSPPPSSFELGYGALHAMKGPTVVPCIAASYRFRLKLEGQSRGGLLRTFLT